MAVLAITRDTVSDGDEAVMKLVFPADDEESRTGECARVVFDHGGDVIAVMEDDLPNGAKEAAIYRY